MGNSVEHLSVVILHDGKYSLHITFLSSSGRLEFSIRACKIDCLITYS